MKTSDKRINRRRFLSLAAAGAAVGALGGKPAHGERGRGASPGATEEDRPNIILIFADDLGYADVGCFGATDIKTPRLDRMAVEGARFTDFYVASSICSPSRAALLTGCYPPRVGITRVFHPSHREGLSDQEISIASLLRSRGYATACIGKWHLGHLPQYLPTRHGFDAYFGVPYSNDMHRDEHGRVLGVPLMRDEEIIERPCDQTTLTKRYTEESLAFIEKNRDRPFFLYLPHTFPHVPLFCSEEFRGRSDGGLLGDVIEELDWSAGRILDALEEWDLDERTLVIFTSDNGPWLSKGDDAGSAAPLRDGKFSTYEGGMRVPTIMRWPGRIPAGMECAEVASTMDFLPTFAHLAGTSPPQDRIIDGKDIRPLLFGEPGARSPHEAFYYYRERNLQGVRSGRWKLQLEQAPSGRGRGESEQPKPRWALYDLETDVGETTDIAAAHPDIVARLEGLLELCRDDLGDARLNRVGGNIRSRASAV